MDPNEVEVKNNDRRNWIATIVAGKVSGKLSAHGASVTRFFRIHMNNPFKVTLFVIVVVCCATLIPGSGGGGSGGGGSSGTQYPPTTYTSKPTTTTTKQTSVGTLPVTTDNPQDNDAILVLQDRFKSV